MKRSELELATEKARVLPEFVLGYTNQSLNGPAEDQNGNSLINSSSDRFSSVQIGLSLPLFGLKNELDRVKAADWNRKKREMELESRKRELDATLLTVKMEYRKLQERFQYEKQNLLPQADLMMKYAARALTGGEIGYLEYTLTMNRALSAHFSHLETQYAIHNAAIEWSFLTEF